jgi:predicted alpha/beta superfamily hydrolase
MKYGYLFLLLTTAVCVQAQYKVSFKLIVAGGVPADSCFIAGNFNGWNPGAAPFRFQPNNGLTVSLPAGTIEYKLTRGGWQTVECQANGIDIANRTITITSDTTIECSVAAWKDAFKNKPRPSTASKNVSAGTAFVIPHLQLIRTVRIYLPPDYATGSERYPVVYMHDGQNLFDAALNPFGEWGVDEYLDSAKKKCIIVGIDNGQETRLQEYNPYNSKVSGTGKGKQYVAFIVNTLKPYIDKKFRTLKDRRHTFMAGSSMGAHISLYAALQYPKVFGKVGLFSPAFWINIDEVQNEIKKAPARSGQGFYIYAGGNEGVQLLRESIKVFDLLRTKHLGNQYKLSVKTEGEHKEHSWRKELPAFFQWLLK